MMNVRIIARLDVKGQNLVKGVNLEGLRVLGLPERFSAHYFREGADELIYMDTVASLYGRNNLEEIVQRTAKNVFIPITVGGGIRSVDDIRRLLRAGADKVAINTAAIQNPELIKEGARVFGSQCIVVSIEAIKNAEGQYEAYTDSGREPTGKDVFEWAKQAVDLGAGEILITSVDQEGTGKGYDTDLISRVVADVTVPVIACGGAGKSSDFETVIKCSHVNAVCAASIFHYHAIQSFGVQRREEGNVEFLKSAISEGNAGIKNLQPLSIRNLKMDMVRKGIACQTFSENRNSPPTMTRFLENKKSYKKRPSALLIDYRRSNMFSVINALRQVDADVQVSDDADKIYQAERLVLAGVGAFGAGMKSLKSKNIDEAIKAALKKGTSIFGICLGMQLLMEQGEEFGLHRGLGLIPGKVTHLSNDMNGIRKIKTPHIGWNKILMAKSINGNGNNPVNGDNWKGEKILEDIPPNSSMYFVHSFVVVPDSEQVKVSETEYGSKRFVSIIRKDNIVGCQFHPEKSGFQGIKIYRNFLRNF
jgi:imidazole glycerol-phosphate synthase subunit HisF